MQVYLSVFATDGPQMQDGATAYFLIVQKRIWNCWWKGEVTHRKTVLNQAGQWALPGGKLENLYEVAHPHLAAAREFHEESGIIVGQILSCRQFIDTSPRPEWILIRYQLTYPDLYQLWSAIQSNTSPNGDPRTAVTPRATQAVKDWEWTNPHLVSYPSLSLGVPVPLDHDTQAWLTQQKPKEGSQAIDWYATIAAALTNLNHQNWLPCT